MFVNEVGGGDHYACGLTVYMEYSTPFLLLFACFLYSFFFAIFFCCSNQIGLNQLLMFGRV
jgi:hypothetical protein